MADSDDPGERISDAEHAVMEALWRESPRTAAEICDEVSEQRGWSLATACSLLAWYVFAPQCLSTLAIVKRETNSWRYPIIMAAYLFALAYIAAFITYRVVGSWA